MARTSTSGARNPGSTPSRRPGATGEHDSAPEPAADSGDILDDRKAAILKAVVAEYVESATPVGSGHITGSPGVEVSSATVRSDMAALEREGYLVQPHTSAGRIPTDKGYRYFVDHLGRQGALGPHERSLVRQFFRHVHGEVEDMLGRAGGLLADLTDYASVVVGPTHELATVRSVQLVELGPGLALFVAVLSDGSVEKRTLEIPDGAGEQDLVAVAGAMSMALVGRTLSEAKAMAAVPGVHDELARRSATALAEMAVLDEHELVYVGGSSRMAAAFDAMDTVRSVLSILEQQLVVVQLLEQILDRGLSVAIGTEHGFEPLASCALVVAPLAIEGESAGTIGLVGPTRMNYPRALAAVHVVGEQLSERLGGSSRPTDSSGRGGGRRGR